MKTINKRNEYNFLYFMRLKIRSYLNNEIPNNKKYQIY